MANIVEISLAVADDALEGVRKALSERGATDIEVLETIGVIRCRSDAAELEALRELPGVDAVEVTREIHIAPPKSPVQ